VNFSASGSADGAHAGQAVGGVADAVVVVHPPCLLLPPSSSVDLGHVGTGQDDGDELDEGENDADAGVDDHHRQDVALELVHEEGHAAVHKDLVTDLVGAHREDSSSTALVDLVAAGVGDGEVGSDGGTPVVVVADQVVVAAAAVEVSLELVPFGGDGPIDAVLVEVLVDVGGRDGGLRDGRPQLERDEDGDELGQEGDGEEDGVGRQEEPLLRPGNGEAEEADAEGVDAEDDHVGGDDGEVGGPEVELVDVVELHEDDGREDEDGGGDEEEDVAQVEELLVLGHPRLDDRQGGLLRA